MFKRIAALARVQIASNILIVLSRSTVDSSGIVVTIRNGLEINTFFTPLTSSDNKISVNNNNNNNKTRKSEVMKEE